MEKPHYIDREKSWLLFNGRVLQEAADDTVPLIERMRFLGIFSNNLDEFFRVRYATIRRLSVLGNQAADLLAGVSPKALLSEISAVVIEQQHMFEDILAQIRTDLRSEGIHMVDEKGLDERQIEFIDDYFEERLSPALVPIMLNYVDEFPMLRDKSIYHAVKLVKDNGNRVDYALIEIPTEVFPRFVVLPNRGNDKYIMYLDDVIRHFLHRIFATFEFDELEAFTIKLTRDAELDIDNDISRSFIDKISRSVKARKKAEPVRFVYDKMMPQDLLDFLMHGLEADAESDSLIPGGRYHNKKDFMDFPNVGGPQLEYKSHQPAKRPELDSEVSFLRILDERDILLHYPYQSFSYLIRMLREAAIDPQVSSIKATLYRAAKNSQFLNALVNAAKNGKNVTVVIELQARFDEEANIKWTQRLQDEGVNVIYGVPGLKVHSKLVLINRKNDDGSKTRYTCVSTGNFNEKTARLYCDYALYTSDKRITKEVNQVFKFFRNNFNIPEYDHLIVSPHYTRKAIYDLIDEEIEKFTSGREALLHFKMNGLVDEEMIDKLYEASKAGVQIKLNIRGICSLIPGIPGLSENSEAISIVDKFLEHARVYVFGAGAAAKVYISSADLMTRNLDNRVEVTVPIYDDEARQEILSNLEIGWMDNVKSRWHDQDYDNKYRRTGASERNRSQVMLQKYYADKEDHS
ncbi:MAG: polyphosphate kinase 1 [Flavobacteriales bacterium]|nr:polyphosphate kinase 1 [Flavobacteriales bacterium]